MRVGPFLLLEEARRLPIILLLVTPFTFIGSVKWQLSFAMRFSRTPGGARDNFIFVGAHGRQRRAASMCRRQRPLAIPSAIAMSQRLAAQPSPSISISVVRARLMFFAPSINRTAAVTLSKSTDRI